MLSGIGIQSVQWEALSCTAMSMNFFDCLIDKGSLTIAINIYFVGVILE